MGYFASIYPVVHIARRYTAVDPDTGNKVLIAEDPVVRYVQEVVHLDSKDTLTGSGEFQDRVASTLQMAVDDPTVYASEDQVVIAPVLDVDGEWVPGTGEAYWVDGLPDDQRGGPWPQLFQHFGGIVTLKRVT